MSAPVGQVKLDGSQIDQCILLSKSLLTVHPTRTHAITLEGTASTADGRSSKRIRGRIFDANSYGYFRELRVHVSEPPEWNDKIITVGGRNAIVEDLALENCTITIDEFVPAVIQAEIRDELLTDSEVLQLELAPAEAEHLQQALTRICDEYARQASNVPRAIALHWALTARLKRLRDILQPEQFTSICRKLLHAAQSFVEPDFLMFLCEAVWFWVDRGELAATLHEPISSLLQKGMKHHDPNIRLAAIISASKYCASLDATDESRLQEHEKRLLCSIGRLICDSFLSASAYFEQVFATCHRVLPQLRDPRRDDLKKAVFLLSAIPDRAAGLIPWFSNVADGPSIVLLMHVVLWKSHLVTGVNILRHEFDTNHGVYAIEVDISSNNQESRVYVLCATDPADFNFQQWLSDATNQSVIPQNSQPLRIAARAGADTSYEPVGRVICGGDLYQLIMNESRLDEELKSRSQNP